MGSSSILDILGSFFVFGLLFVMALRLNASATEYNSAYFANYVLQRNLIILVNLLEDDFKRIGYCKNSSMIPNAADAIVYCDSNKFAFLTDIATLSDREGDGVVDRVEYSLGPASELTETPNPRDRYLYRKLNNNPAERWNLGLTQFKFVYYNYLEDLMTYAQAMATPSNVGLVDLTVQLESPSPMKQEYMMDTTQYQIFWRQIRLSSKNLRNR